MNEELPVTWLITRSYARHSHKEPEILHQAYVGIAATLCTFFNPIPHGGGGGADSALLQIVFFITSVRDAAEPRNLETFSKS